MSAALPDPEELVDQYWPRYGPYSPQRLETALDAAAELLRYAAYATEAGASSPALATAPDGYQALGALGNAVYRLHDLARRLAAAAGALSHDPSLRHDQHRTQPDRAAAAAHAAAEDLSQAAVLAHELGRIVGRAHNQLVHLYHQREEDR